MEEVEIVEESLPLIIRSKVGNESVTFLKNWITENKEWIAAKLIEHGAIMFRGFTITEGIHFEQVVQKFQPELSDEYRGTSPRQAIPGTQFVFSASEIPSFMPIPQHLEMSFLRSPPRNIFFCCLEAPTSFGGETTLCDFKKVYDELDTNIKNEFETKKVTYIRNYNGKKTFLTDPTMLKGWQDVFDTNDKETVEKECRKNAIDIHWKRGNGLRLVNTESAIEKHPDTGHKVWFNHAGVFHWSVIAAEYYRIYKHSGWIRFFFLWLIALVAKLFFLHIFGSDNVGFHTRFGNGEEIPGNYQSHLGDIIWRNMVFNRWEKGDIVMIDNFRVSHGRQPYSGRRKVVVSWSKPTLKPSYT